MIRNSTNTNNIMETEVALKDWILYYHKLCEVNSGEIFSGNEIITDFDDPVLSDPLLNLKPLPKNEVTVNKDNVIKDNDYSSNGCDFAKSKFHIKGLVGLLTTASVYIGLDNSTNPSYDISQACEFDLEDNTVQQGTGRSANMNPACKVAGFNKSSVRDTIFNIFKIPKKDEKISNDMEVNNTLSRDLDYKKDLFEFVRKYFGISEEETLIGHYTGWLLQEVLIQGNLFITNSSLVYLAHLPKLTDAVVLCGKLKLRSRLKGNPRYWCVLKHSTLALYNDPSDIYFPILSIDLNHVEEISLENSLKDENTMTFVLEASSKNYKFIAGSSHSAKTWVKCLKKQLFSIKNQSKDTIGIKFPISSIIDVECQSYMNQGQSIKVKCFDGNKNYALKEYTFLFFDKDGDSFYNIISNFIPRNMNPVEASLQNSNPTIHLNSKSHFNDKIKILSAVNIDDIICDTDSFEMTSSDILSDIDENIQPLSLKHVRDISNCKNYLKEDLKTSNKMTIQDCNKKVQTSEIQLITYSKHDSRMELNDDSKYYQGNIGNDNKGILSFKNICSIWNTSPIHNKDSDNFFMTSDPFVTSINDTTLAKIKDWFNLHDNEVLHALYYAYLIKGYPVYGKLYVTNRRLYFKSCIPGVNVKMVLPLEDIEGYNEILGTNYGNFGILLTVQNEKELQFGFNSCTNRSDFENVLQRCLDICKYAIKTPELVTSRVIESESEHSRLRFFEEKFSTEGIDIPFLVEDNPYFKTKIMPTKSYNFGFLTIGSRGDVQPYIALAKGLIQEGHSVTIITHREFKSFVECHGIDFKEIAGDPTKLMSLMVEHEAINVGMLMEASSKFRGWIHDLLVTTWEACKNLKLDILIESPSAMAGIHISEALQIPYFRAFTMPWTRTRAYPHAFIVPDQKRGGSFNYLTHVIFENVFWRGICSQVNKWRVQTLGLEKTNLAQLQQNKIPFLYNISPVIFPPAIDFDEWIKVTGYWFLDESESFEPSQELETFISKARKLGKKLVYIGFGSIVVNNAKEMTRAVIDSVLETDIFCILNKGWSERLGKEELRYEEEPEYPETIFLCDSIPHDWLFPKVDAAVHHGGSGTTGATLKAGTPVVIKPFFGDQFFFASRIEDIGAGIALKKLNVSSLSNAIKKVLTDKSIKRKAVSLKKRVAKENGVTTAINCIYSELEYARSLVVKKNHKSSNIEFIQHPNNVNDTTKTVIPLTSMV
ncbi:hypothetical protein Kpol_2000p77 [Vanderwaltozyma polyspora DSM 70294]|uniref:Sterol 3-beta-glucosyltransferase n=1 Tax=Vanderwaltozyma polyspora (strain ATCC 22028 / DSM 70294 / BCRC 21397 / CBS 2163 / NBRC 10782 / NRRL Y-8283 / UCD 57-17) TaxID=436907 RepID=ATG26_VANPO|nr:uncharacterized protein Kpol_2000p77 [Vanderwaltozyma polyspora DSM 70294]A7TF84.1 RecName: Full=Sterol 3-beta-glucosyltransferase; AltName: Full=Autophagy-related protein 26 [Vanderwaltozyma polyspora DSM 70294]EDO19109.1 hypothetical protein Kpol_2000p77 [Vanderwaltozyma polyspora DSM 70294]